MPAQLTKSEYEAEEDAKYSWLYNTKYGHGPVVVFSRWSFPRYSRPTNNLRILDWGCGQGLAYERIGELDYTGVDISSAVIARNKARNPKGNWIHGNLTAPEIGIKLDGEYDLGFCCDVLEHIPTPLIDAAIENLCSRTKTQMISVSCVPSKNKDQNGGDLHLTHWTPKQWHDAISKHTTIQDFKETTTTAYFICGENYTTPRIESIPQTIGKVRIRQHDDGSIWIARKHKATENILDRLYTRKSTDLRWYPKILGYKEFETLENLYPDRTCYLVGKGPSLDKLTAADFPDPTAPIIFINDSVVRAKELDLPNPIYNTQFDGGIHCTPPNEDIGLILAISTQYLYPAWANRYVVDHSKFGLSDRSLSVLCCIGFSKYLGCSNVTMLAFDACMDQDTKYADAVKGRPVNNQNKNPARFLQHRKMIDRILREQEIEAVWARPKGPMTAVLSSDIPDESSHNPQEHCEHPHSESQDETP